MCITAFTEAVPKPVFYSLRDTGMAGEEPQETCWFDRHIGVPSLLQSSPWVYMPPHPSHWTVRFCCNFLISRYRALPSPLFQLCHSTCPPHILGLFPVNSPSLTPSLLAYPLSLNLAIPQPMSMPLLLSPQCHVSLYTASCSLTHPTPLTIGLHCFSVSQ